MKNSIREAVDEARVDLMKSRVKQALLDAGNGIPHEEIQRRAEVDQDDSEDIYYYRMGFASLMNEGEIARTSCGWKRAENPWKTGGKVR